MTGSRRDRRRRTVRSSVTTQEEHMAGIRVTPEQLGTLSSRVAGSAGSIEAELHALAASLAPLGGDWAGVAQQRFETLWDEWQRGARTLHDALLGISQLLGRAGAHYAEAEQAIASSFSAM
jgi:WXG100 family type VII secretion target